MSPEYPYQLVAFLDSTPSVGKGVYQGSEGWYPQIALKRRFVAVNMSEDDLLSTLSDFAAKNMPLYLKTGKLVKPERMPVRVVDILNKEEVKKFHLDFIDFMGERMESRYPERDGENYLPHITAEYEGKFVIDYHKFTNKTFVINKICLIKDEEDTDSHVVAYFDLNKASLFPKDFLWGAATAAHQVEGNNHNQWTEWEDKNAIRLASKAEKSLSKFESWERVKAEAQDSANYISGQASGSYELYKKDFDLLDAMNMNAYRFSVEWSRIEPQENEWDQQSIEHYKDMLKELRSREIEPAVTLFHFTVPVWFANKGGFEKNKNIKYFTQFVEKIVSELGEYATYFITVNEPEVYSSISYIAKMWPPAKRNVLKALMVQINLAKAHNESAKLIHQLNPTHQVSVAKHSLHFYSEKNTWLDWLTIHFLQYVMDDFFMKRVVEHCDFIGINYYQSMRVNGFTVQAPKVQANDLNWAMQPSDLEHVLIRFHKKYHKPIMVTENGLADGQDAYRKWWIEASIKAMESALQHGVELKGYFHWSLIDNFEWAYGKWPHFGLASVDSETKERTLRPSAQWFGKEIKRYRSK